MDWGKAQERLQCLQFFAFLTKNYFLFASVLDWWCINKIFENKRECVFPAIKRAIKQVNKTRKYLEKKKSSKSELLPLNSLMGPLIPFLALIKKKQC